MIRTSRLELLSANVRLADADDNDKTRFAELLHAQVPPEWPPESLRKCLPHYYHALRLWPAWRWRLWYAIAREPSGNTLCGAVSFMNPVGLPGIAEVGYSLLPEFQGRGLATEMVIRLTGWIERQHHMRVVLAEVHKQNIASLRVVERAGFQMIGRGSKPGTLLFCH